MARIDDLFRSLAKAEKNFVFKNKVLYPYTYKFDEALIMLQGVEMYNWMAQFCKGPSLFAPVYGFTLENGETIRANYWGVFLSTANDAAFFKLTWF